MASSAFRDFLTYTPSQKEVSLVFAKDETEQDHFLQELEGQGFKQIFTLYELLDTVTSPTKSFYLIQDELPVDVYEFIQQYPTRHIGIYDKVSKKFAVTNPVYKDVSLVFVVTKAHLQNLHNQGFTLFDKVGLTYQEQ